MHEQGDFGASDEESVELRKEVYTTALYVAICLLAALIAIPAEALSHRSGLGLVWGVTLGLTAAHWFAFRMSARLVSAGRIRSQDAKSAGAQLVGAALVAVLASIPLVLLPNPIDLIVLRYVLGAFIAAFGFAVARSTGAAVIRSLVYAAVVLVAAIGIALLKNVLSH